MLYECKFSKSFEWDRQLTLQTWNKLEWEHNWGWKVRHHPKTKLDFDLSSFLDFANTLSVNYQKYGVGGN